MNQNLTHNPVDCILEKRDGRALSPDRIKWLIEAFVAGQVPDYQMSAFLMATLLQGMTEEETVALTRAMINSGDVIDLSSLPGIKVDKHSTGGVGDKISLVLAPLVAELGVPVPMISGRSLGHSGGTLDKLESIPGFRADLSVKEFTQQLKTIGVAITGQTSQIAPADQKMYALRDVTGTVECMPLITASILSKKIASGIDALVLDVKCGSGAFMASRETAKKLAESLVQVGGLFDKNIVALLTDMNQPLGYGIGNWPEVVDAVLALQGREIPQVTELVVRQAAEMLVLGGIVQERDEGVEIARATLGSGKAFERFCQMVSAQGGDVSLLDKPLVRHGFVPSYIVRAPEGMSGVVKTLDPKTIGRVAMSLGAGRMTKDDAVDPLAGILLNKKPGESVQPGEEIAAMFTRKAGMCPKLAEQVVGAYTVSSEPSPPGPVLIGRFDGHSWTFAA